MFFYDRRIFGIFKEISRVYSRGATKSKYIIQIEQMSSKQIIPQIFKQKYAGWLFLDSVPRSGTGIEYYAWKQWWLLTIWNSWADGLMILWSFAFFTSNWKRFLVFDELFDSVQHTTQYFDSAIQPVFRNSMNFFSSFFANPLATSTSIRINVKTHLVLYALAGHP